MRVLEQALVDEIERLRDNQLRLSRKRTNLADPIYGISRSMVYEELEKSYSKILKDLHETSKC